MYVFEEFQDDNEQIFKEIGRNLLKWGFWWVWGGSARGQIVGI